MLRPTLYFVPIGIFLIFFCNACGNKKPLPTVKDKIPKEDITILYKKAERYSSSNPDSLSIAANQILKFGKLYNDHKAIVMAEKYIARTHWNSGNHSLSMKVALRALKNAEKWGVNSEIPDIYAIIGNLHKEKQNYVMALEAADEGMKVANKEKDTISVIYMARLKAMFTQGIGANTKDTALIHRSLNMHLQWLKLAESNSSPRFEQARIAYYNNIAQVYTKRKQMDSAEFYINKAIVLAKKYDQLISLTYSYTWLSKVYDSRGQSDSSLACLNRALKIAQDLERPHREMEIYDYMMESLRNAGNYKEALSAYTRYSALRDSMQILKNVRQVGELQLQYEDQKKDQQISVLGEINKVRLKQTVGALIGLGLFILVSVVMFIQYRIIRRNNAELAESNRKIYDQSDKMQFLMKELHHRVKNNLQIVSNLLSLQANRLTDDDSRKIIKAGQQRIETMSIIHKNLYSQENVNLVNMKAYVTDLLESVMQSFGVEENQIDLNITVDIKELDIDIAMPLGLIINEWITNSFKHAFQDVERPVVCLKLIEYKGKIQLEIRDNGPGFDLNKWERPNGSFGVRLIKVLSKQLEGFCRVVQDSGACFQLEVPIKSSGKSASELQKRARQTSVF